MKWTGFTPYPLSTTTDWWMVGRKSYIAAFQAIGVEITTKIGGVEASGFLGVLDLIFQRKDWRAFMQPHPRLIWLPDVISPPLKDLELRAG